MTLSKSSSLLLSDSLLFFLFALLPLKFFFVLFSSFVFLYHCISMKTRLGAHAKVQKVVEIVSMLCNRMDIKLNLTIELRDKGTMDRMLSRLA
jgi:hypothetical protein